MIYDKDLLETWEDRLLKVISHTADYLAVREFIKAVLKEKEKQIRCEMGGY